MTEKKCIPSWQWKVEIALKWIPFSDIGVDIVDACHAQEPFESSM